AVLESREQRHAEQNDVEPVLDERERERGIVRQERGRERHKRDREKEDELDPREVPVAASQLAELGSLYDPEDAERRPGLSTRSVMPTAKIPSEMPASRSRFVPANSLYRCLPPGRRLTREGSCEIARAA